MARPSSPLEWVAAGISDPVLRLKFLQRTAALPARRPRCRGKAVWVPALAMVLAVPAAMVLSRWSSRAPVLAAPPVVAIPRLAPPAAWVTHGVPTVWLVENSRESETYSNGLRVDVRYMVSNRPRSYRALRVNTGGTEPGPLRTDPAGIVFHSTESRQAPLEPEENRVLQRLGQGVLGYVRSRKCYHYLIDRFGRVYRVVQDSDAANHAGHSVWSDGRWTYIDLNESFLGVSFEAATRNEATAGAAQIRAAAMLTEMLRSRYKIGAEDCVTHAQVSVNPSNMRAGYHTDWASGFPFERLGLPDNYGKAPASVEWFGFEADPGLLASGMREGVARANASVRAGAGAAGLSGGAYRKLLHRRYKQAVTRLRR